MRRIIAAGFGVVALFTTSTSLSAKGDMVLVEIRGEVLTAPLKITDPKIMDFNVWAGPGVNGTTVENADGFIADWRKGSVAEPHTSITRYDVRFYVGCRTSPTPSCLQKPPALCYNVTYAYDLSSAQGFVYFPGKGEASYYLNIGTIGHGPNVEGHWFVTSEEWERFVRPLIADAGVKNRPGP
jgi:hypothetical protein